ncbi:MAG: DEAD/DEAH box helicase [Proteobacteria bacterium]|nr:DEAD/DEAH box helicase [Pseudomonadota bacterium]NBP13330.1 DEAD/DEAH box helicase [bacterium]
MVYFDLDKSKKYGTITGDHINDIREHFSVKNEGARFARMRGRFIPARTYAITPGGRLDPCMFFEITKFLLQNNYCHQDEIRASKDFLNYILPAPTTLHTNIHYTSQAYDNLNLKLRDYQKAIVTKCLEAGRGTVVLATAGGKTLIMASLLSNFFHMKNNFKCLLIVPDLGLVEQTFTDFNSYNSPFISRKWTGKQPLDNDNVGAANVVIANLGILQSENSDLSWLENIDFVIVDEVHKVRRGNKVNNILKEIKTQLRFGFTGTLPEDKLDQWNIIGKIGPVIYEKNSFQLRKENYISNVTANILELHYSVSPPEPKESFNPSEKYRTELEFLFENTFRNKTIAAVANNAPNNVLILIDYIKHGEALYNYLTTCCNRKQIFFIRGEVEVEDRNKVRQLMEKHNNIVCIAISKIFSTGVNIKNLHFIVFAGGGKAKVRTIQSIGRGLRLHETKDRLYIIDIADQFTYGKRHQLKRQTLYDQETIPYQTKKIFEKV